MQEMVPKYYLIKQEIIDMINREEIDENGMVPSERELMAMFGVSRITVRKAITDLVNEGYLYTVQGKGTFVRTDELNRDLVSIMSCTEDIRRMGMVPSKKVICAEVIPADKKRIKRLQLAEGDHVLKLQRVYYANNEPLNYTTTYLPCKLFPGIEEHDFGQESVYQVLEQEYNVKIATATRTLEAVLALDDVSERLEMTPGQPVILFRAVTFGIMNRRELPIEVFKSYYRSDKFKFYIKQVR
ncbi:GntR family transcriptional regulator [Candidatus Darwinibacter acetoxidans]